MRVTCMKIHDTSYITTVQTHTNVNIKIRDQTNLLTSLEKKRTWKAPVTTCPIESHDVTDAHQVKAQASHGNGHVEEWDKSVY